MLTKKQPPTVFSQIMLVSWSLIVVGVLAFLAGIFGIFSISYVPYITLPLMALAICCTLVGVLYTGEEVEREHQAHRHA